MQELRPYRASLLGTYEEVLMARCEDYPACGHTDGLPCDHDTSFYRSDEYMTYLNNHYGCDHEAGWCAADDDDEEDTDD